VKRFAAVLICALLILSSVCAQDYTFARERMLETAELFSR